MPLPNPACGGSPIVQMALRLSHTNSRLLLGLASFDHHIVGSQNKYHQQMVDVDLMHLNHCQFVRLTLFGIQCIQDGLLRISRLVVVCPNSDFWTMPSQYCFPANRHTDHS